MINGTPKLVQNDPWLIPFEDIIKNRHRKFCEKEKALTMGLPLSDFASGYLYFGLHKEIDCWIFREWAPNATAIYLVGEFNNWQILPEFALTRINKTGTWEISLPHNKLKHEQQYHLNVQWKEGSGDRIPAWTRRAVQDEKSLVFNAQVWWPEKPYQWKNPKIDIPKHPIIYETHVGMATEEQKVGSFTEFRKNILPHIKKSGYNTIQLMAIQEHPYYGSFGYHVSNLFAVSSRFGTPDELKELIDEAHGMGIAVIMDLVHSHAVKNEFEGLGNFDGNPSQYFHPGARREHIAWDSLCFDYGKNEVLHFLLSNCKFWLEEYHFDGFRYDGVTSMIYYDHGLGKNFMSYKDYYDGGQDEDAIVFLMLSNKLVHLIQPNAISIAEEVSGMPGLASPLEYGGYGFDYRMAMGTPDYWIKLIKDIPDENWNVSEIYWELIKKRQDEKTIAYVESHDQALVGDKTILFRLLEKEIYYNMSKQNQSLIVDRGIALHKMIRLITIATGGNGYLNFMGNEFGHPEWIDFPRAGNNWSYHYARRQWSLIKNDLLKYHYLSDFDKDMLELIKKENIFSHSFVRLISDNIDAKVLIFERADLIFVFNFNPSQSFTDYAIDVTPSKYQIILNSDSKKFGGFNLIDESMIYYSSKTTNDANEPYRLRLYIPSRTAFVLKKLQVKKVR